MLTRTDAHITTWVVAIILFIIALALHKSGREKASIIVHMILRVFYILVIITGALLFAHFQGMYPALYGIKLVGGILVIGMLEMILVRSKNGKGTGLFWLLLIIFFLGVLYLGLRLPAGLTTFA